MVKNFYFHYVLDIYIGTSLQTVSFHSHLSNNENVTRHVWARNKRVNKKRAIVSFYNVHESVSVSRIHWNILVSSLRWIIQSSTTIKKQTAICFIFLGPKSVRGLVRSLQSRSVRVSRNMVHNLLTVSRSTCLNIFKDATILSLCLFLLSGDRYVIISPGRVYGIRARLKEHSGPRVSSSFRYEVTLRQRSFAAETEFFNCTVL